MKKMNLLVLTIAAVMGLVGTGFAADVPFTVTAPTFDWTVLGTIATAILLASVGMAIFARSKRVIR